MRGCADKCSTFGGQHTEADCEVKGGVGGCSWCIVLQAAVRDIVVGG